MDTQKHPREMTPAEVSAMPTLDQFERIPTPQGPGLYRTVVKKRLARVSVFNADDPIAVQDADGVLWTYERDEDGRWCRHMAFPF